LKKKNEIETDDQNDFESCADKSVSAMPDHAEMSGSRERKERRNVEAYRHVRQR
jgi:hypothetical protein